MIEDAPPPAQPANAAPEGAAPPAETPPAGSQPAEAPPSGPRAAPDLLRIAGGFYGVILLFAFGYALFGGTGNQPFLGLGLTSLPLLLGGIGIGLVVVGLVHVGLRLFDSVEDGARALARILGPLTIRDALYLALFSSVAEELLFRGALWPHLGLIGTTCLFGLVHVLPRKSLWGYPLFATVVGLLIGLLRMATEDEADGSGSVLPCVLAHFTINALNLAWLGAHHDRLLAKDASVKSDGPVA